jgi:hypothetical protein
VKRIAITCSVTVLVRPLISNLSGYEKKCMEGSTTEIEMILHIFEDRNGQRDVRCGLMYKERNERST